MEKRQRHIEIVQGVNKALIERMNELMLDGRKSLPLGTVRLSLIMDSLWKCEMFETLTLFLNAFLTSCQAYLLLVLLDCIVI